MSMRAVVIKKQGTPVAANVEVVPDWPEAPPPRPGEVMLKVEATALNQLDLWVGRGVPGLTLEYPRISGSDVCGIVESVGSEVDHAWVGRRVILNAAVIEPSEPSPHGDFTLPAIRMIGEHNHGVHRERLGVPAGQIIEVGEQVDPTEAAAFGLTFLTAWRGLVSRGEIRAGESVLITGIGGGVALAVLNIAKHFGCMTIVTSRHESKLEMASRLGADHSVLDTGQDWSRDVRSITHKAGVNIAFDSVGKATHLTCLKALARGGRYITPGCTTGPDAVTDLARIFWNQLKIIGTTMGTMSESAEVVALLRTAQLKPVIDSIHPASNGAEAYARLESADQFGKVVIDWR